MTYQHRLQLQRVEQQASLTQKIQRARNSITVGLKDNFAGVTATDKGLRIVQCVLDVEAVDKLIEELKTARASMAL